LRLSANQVGKLTNELKITCNENEELKRRLQEMGDMGRKVSEYENRIAMLSQEIERLNAVIEGKNRDIGGLQNRLNEIESMNKTIGSLQERITRLVTENT